MENSNNKSVFSKVLQAVAAVAALLGFSAGAQAQQFDLVGLWQCEYGVRPISDSNLPTVYLALQMQLNSDYTMQAQGIMNEQSEFVAQGQWEVAADGSFSAVGQKQDWLGVSPFIFGSRVTSGTTMSMQIADNINLLVTRCQKIQ